jgi:hypothetical protein
MVDAKRIHELMVLTAWANGKVEPSEALALHKLVASNPHLHALPDKPETAKKMKARIDEVGLDPAVREVAAAVADRSDREIAFSLCARVLDADGDLSLEEADVLSSLQEVFGFSGEDVTRLMRSLQETA